MAKKTPTAGGPFLDASLRVKRSHARVQAQYIRNKTGPDPTFKKKFHLFSNLRYIALFSILLYLLQTCTKRPFFPHVL